VTAPFLRSSAGLVIAILFAAGCSDDAADSSPEQSTTTAAAASSGADDEEIQKGPPPPSPSITITLSELSPIAARVVVDTVEPVTVQITAESANHTVSTPVTAALSDTHDLPLVGLRQNSDYTVAITTTDADGGIGQSRVQLMTGALPDGLPELDIAIYPDQASPGITILELNPVAANFSGEGNPIVGVDQWGEYVWYHNAGSFTGAAQRTPSGDVAFQHDPFAFSVTDITGRRLAEYYPDPTGADAESTAGDGTRLVPYHADWVELGPVHHDIVPMADGSFLALSTTEHGVPAEQRAALCPGDEFEWDIFSDVIMHITADGAVLRTWDLYDISSFEAHPGEFLCNRQGLGITETRRDWTHANALWFDESRDAIIVSSRHTDQLIALAMTDAAGPQTEVRWILGNDATIPYEGETFHHTHGVKTVTGGDLLFYDNGNFRPGTLSAGGDEPDYSRAVRVSVDDSSDDPLDWTATQVWDHRMVDPVTDLPLYAPFLSDADELSNGNILVTHGGAVIDPADFLNSHVVVVEIVPDTEAGGDEGGEIVWQLSLGDAEESVSMYRADRWDSLYFGPLWAVE